MSNEARPRLGLPDRVPGSRIGRRRVAIAAAKLLARIAFGGAAVTGAGAAQPPPTQSDAALVAQAQAIMGAAYPAEGPGAAVIVSRAGQTIFSAGRGLADLEARRPITAGTAFRLGSITKQFTAAVILQLVAEGRISLDDPLSRFFPDWPPPGAGATVRQLLNHSSGLMDYSKIPGWMGSEPSLRPHTTAELLALTRSRPAPSAPGVRWEYNNGGYAVLGAIVEQVTGKPWHQAAIDRIARPLGLRTIAYAGDADLAVARGYSGQGDRQQPARGVHISVAGAAGGLVGSVEDLARWAAALHGGRVVGPALYAEMVRPARLADGSTHRYGFGLRLLSLRGQPALVHGGSGRGLDAESIYLPSERLFVAALANSDDPTTDPAILVRRLAALALGKPYPVFSRAEIDVAEVEPLFGQYTQADGPPFRFFARDGKLLVGHGDDEKEAFAAGADRFFFGPESLMWFEVARARDGAHLMRMHEPDAAEPSRALRTGPVPPPLAVSAPVLQSYLGAYQTETLAVTIALGPDGALTVAPAGQRAMRMRPVSPTEFRIDGGPMRLVFHPEGDRVDRFTLYRGARELHGRRVDRSPATPE
ncbi:MAG TPA: serine hydrolase domain-containing protein [Allosphingosinicella sp.]|jgi:CubicO group peptidase (beta-lactamase class C family)